MRLFILGLALLLNPLYAEDNRVLIRFDAPSVYADVNKICRPDSTEYFFYFEGVLSEGSIQSATLLKSIRPSSRRFTAQIPLTPDELNAISFAGVDGNIWIEEFPVSTRLFLWLHKNTTSRYCRHSVQTIASPPRFSFDLSTLGNSGVALSDTQPLRGTVREGFRFIGKMALTQKKAVIPKPLIPGGLIK